MTNNRIALRVPGADFSSLGLGTAASLWNPTSMGSALAAWFDAADPNTITTNSAGKIIGWKSKDPTGWSLVQFAADTTYLPTIGQMANGAAAVKFVDGGGAGAASMLKGGGPLNTAGLSCFLVLQRGAGTFSGVTPYMRSALTLPGCYSGGVWQRAMIGHMDAIVDPAQATLYAGGHDTDPAGNAPWPAVAVGDAAIVSATFAPGSSGVLFWCNGRDPVRATGWYGGTTPANWWFVGGNAVANQQVADWIAQIIVVKGIVSPTMRLTIEGWLAWKCGLASLLPTAHPFYCDGPYA